jgi:hypothetical protein|tara:strand:- start:248 stop:466 length:219 start_codon:yes stop_codon:yes gene_type:complete
MRYDMPTEKELKFLRGLIDYHRNQFGYWSSNDEIDYDKSYYQEFYNLREWLLSSGHINKDDDILKFLDNLSN